MKRTLSLVAAAATLAVTSLANATNTTITYIDFSSTDGLLLNGEATTFGNDVRLTPMQEDAVGSVFTEDRIDLGDDRSFSTAFQFRISNNGGRSPDPAGGRGADGLVFVLQDQANNLGAEGDGIGYAGIPSSVGIEFDTWFNDPRAFFTGDADGNHVAVNFGGRLDRPEAYTEISPLMTNGEIWYAWADYDGVADLFEVRLSETNLRPLLPTLSFTADLVNVIGTELAFVGFTSATGTEYSTHDIIGWQFVNRFDPIPYVGGIPTPGALPVLAFGGLLAAAMIKRNKA